MGRLIDLRRLPPEEAARVLDRVIALDSRIFRHRSDEVRDRFYAGFRSLTNAEKHVVLYEEGGELIGFNLIKIAPIQVEGRTYWAVGSVAGFLPGHVGGGRTFPDAIRAMLRVKMRHPDRTFYFVSFVLNPGGYDLLVELCPDTYPSARRPRSSGIEPRLIAASARAGGVEILHDDPPKFIITVGRAGRDPFERRRDTENIRFFEALNPGYMDGDALGVCAPLDLPHLVAGAARLLRRRLEKRFAKRSRA